MRSTVLILLVATLTLSACGAWKGSRLNPGNWFGNSREVAVDSEEEANPLIPQRSALARRPEVDRHVPIDQITELRIERTSTGAIIRAEGIARTIGAFEPILTSEIEGNKPDENGVLTYTFEVVYPNRPRPVGTEYSRRISVARSLSFQDLEAVRVIRVTAARNARETRRR